MQKAAISSAHRSSQQVSFVLMYWFATSAVALYKRNSIRYLARLGQRRLETGTECPTTFTFWKTGFRPTSRHALRQLREVAREAGIILFLTGDAVRDLTSGHAVRDLEVAVHGNALKLKKPIEKAGGKVWGEDEPSRTLYLCFPGTVRVDRVSTHRAEYPKPGKPVFHCGFDSGRSAAPRLYRQRHGHLAQ